MGRGSPWTNVLGRLKPLLLKLLLDLVMSRILAIDMLARSPLFGVLTREDTTILADQMRDVLLAPGQMLFGRGDPGKDIYLVMEGRIRLSVLSEEGRELSFAHAVAGDVFGEIAALDDAPRSADATAITHVRLKTLSKGVLRQLMVRTPAVADAAIKLLCSRLRDVSEHFETIALHPVEVRLARLILDRLDTAAIEVGVAELPLEMTQTELGLLIGTTRQRANAALMLLEKAGAIKRSDNMLQCIVPALRRIAQRA
jgi:CRP/FNR family transcriptional regulator, cyclic AMP receptor protein